MVGFVFLHVMSGAPRSEAGDGYEHGCLDALGIATSSSWWTNGAALNAALRALQPGDTLVIPNKTYHIMGGIRSDDVSDVTIRVDGTLAWAVSMDEWPRKASIGADGLHQVLEVFEGMRWSNVVFTSSSTGTLDGNGATWWGLPGVGYVIHLENRPRMMRLDDSSNILFENIFFKNAPYWNFNMRNIDGLEMRHFSVDARRTTDDGHGAVDITASNTDGFDVAGRNVWIHDCSIWNQDDCIAVKDANPSENMVFERITASGLRLSIGSIGAGSHIPNITFRDVYMHKTVKGIYLKFRSGPALVEDGPPRYAIWIGPAQQSDSADLCAAHPCSICWPSTPLAVCNAPPATYIVFEDVFFNNPSTLNFTNYYYCNSVQGVAKGNTFPSPSASRIRLAPALPTAAARPQVTPAAAEESTTR